MNEHYAVDPAAPSNAKDLKILLDQFGLQTGRFLSRYPQDWPQRLLACLEGLSELDRKRAHDILQRRRGYLMAADRIPYQPATTWAGNAAVAAEKHRAFDGVIGQTGNGYGWPALEYVLYDDDGALPAGVGAHVPMQASQYVNCVRPLIAASAEVILVDRFFTLRDKTGSRCRRRWPVMLALLRAAEASGVCQSLRLVLERTQIEATEGTEEALERDLGDASNEASSSRVDIEFDVRESLGHGRYLLSVHGGLQFDQGFEEIKASKNHVHWLSRPELDPLLDRFAPATSLVRR